MPEPAEFSPSCQQPGPSPTDVTTCPSAILTQILESQAAVQSNNRRKQRNRSRGPKEQPAPYNTDNTGEKAIPPASNPDANSILLSIRDDELVPRSDGRRRRKVKLTERAIQSSCISVWYISGCGSDFYSFPRFDRRCKYYSTIATLL